MVSNSSTSTPPSMRRAARSSFDTAPGCEPSCAAALAAADPLAQPLAPQAHAAPRGSRAKPPAVQGLLPEGTARTALELQLRRGGDPLPRRVDPQPALAATAGLPEARRHPPRAPRRPRGLLQAQGAVRHRGSHQRQPPLTDPQREGLPGSRVPDPQSPAQHGSGAPGSRGVTMPLNPRILEQTGTNYPSPTSQQSVGTCLGRVQLRSRNDCDTRTGAPWRFMAHFSTTSPRAWSSSGTKAGPSAPGAQRNCQRSERRPGS